MTEGDAWSVEDQERIRRGVERFYASFGDDEEALNEWRRTAADRPIVTDSVVHDSKDHPEIDLFG